MSPEHIHILTNHLPYLGLGLALIPLVMGLLGRSRSALGSGLILTFICGWSVILVMDTGDQAADRYEKASNHGIRLDADSVKWVEAHREDALLFSKVMYAAAGVSTLALMLCAIKSTWAYPISWIVFILCAASLVTGFLIADSGQKIRRPDFRTEIRMESASEDFADAHHGRLDFLS